MKICAVVEWVMERIVCPRFLEGVSESLIVFHPMLLCWAMWGTIAYFLISLSH